MIDKYPKQNQNFNIVLIDGEVYKSATGGEDNMAILRSFHLYLHVFTIFVLNNYWIFLFGPSFKIRRFFRTNFHCVSM